MLEKGGFQVLLRRTGKEEGFPTLRHHYSNGIPLEIISMADGVRFYPVITIMPEFRHDPNGTVLKIKVRHEKLCYDFAVEIKPPKTSKAIVVDLGDCEVTRATYRPTGVVVPLNRSLFAGVGNR